MTILQAPSFSVHRSHGGCFKLDTPMRYGWTAKNCVVEIPAGTETDFASIPAPFRNLIPTNGKHRLPAVVHDYLYGQAGVIETTHSYGVQDGDVERFKIMRVDYSREDADRAFLVAMRKEGVGKIRAALMYRAVRVFGGLHLKRTGGRTWG